MAFTVFVERCETDETLTLNKVGRDKLLDLIWTIKKQTHSRSLSLSNCLTCSAAEKNMQTKSRKSEPGRQMQSMATTHLYSTFKITHLHANLCDLICLVSYGRVTSKFCRHRDMVSTGLETLQANAVKWSFASNAASWDSESNSRLRHLQAGIGWRCSTYVSYSWFSHMYFILARCFNISIHNLSRNVSIYEHIC